VVHDPIVAPSILSADFGRLADEVAAVTPAVPWLHVDVMDGHFVPNLTIGPDVVRHLRRYSDLFFDTHLMVTDPRTYGPAFVQAGSDSVTFHPETDDDPCGLIDLLHEQGAKVGIAVNPANPLDGLEPLLEKADLLLCMTVVPGFGGQSFMDDVLGKVERAAAWRDAHGAGFRLEVDGGIKVGTACRAAAAGADTFVAGSAVFNAADRPAAVSAILADIATGVA